MATLTIRDLDDDLKAALSVRAAENGRSMEADDTNVVSELAHVWPPAMSTTSQTWV
ncbi:FitA-like ribbon-helix-helix domain-containing protein [Gordonia rhizosphera]|uniref:FitA-like ribbon-helix-helix domain-containing protein n=1 Tax=Gordonia rhizosphera TaxID=83341 RepID=UPI003571172B